MVAATVEPGREAEFNRWYDDEHVADAVSMFPGCLGAARYKVMDGDGTHQYVALYAFGSAAEVTAAISGPEIKELARRYDEAIRAGKVPPESCWSMRFGRQYVQFSPPRSRDEARRNALLRGCRSGITFAIAGWLVAGLAYMIATR